MMADLAENKPSSTPPASHPAPSQSDNALNPNGDSEVNGDESGNQLKQEATDADGNMRPEAATQDGVVVGETRIPSKKDATLREFISKMDEHAPIIPDAVINYYLTLGGLPPPPATPLPLARLLALATQKFIADVAADAYQYSRIRASNTSSSNPMMSNMPGMPAQLPGAAGAAGAGDKVTAEKGEKGKNANLGVQRPGFGGGGSGATQGRTVLTMEDLGMAVGEYGVNVRRGEFYR